jgi:hypothetical protein
VGDGVKISGGWGRKCAEDGAEMSDEERGRGRGMGGGVSWLEESEGSISKDGSPVAEPSQ